MSLVLHNKKNILAISFSVFYIIMLILNIDLKLPLFQNPRYAINSLIVYLTPIITPVFVIVFLLTHKKEHRLKQWLLPIAFGIPVIRSFISLFSSFSIIDLLISDPQNHLLLFCSCLMFLSIILVFIGTFFSFKHINLMKYGALSYAILSLVTLIINFIAVGGFAYLKSVPMGVSPINIIALIRSVSCTLFYIGIFILTTNKRNTDLV